jgi:hypothetical protein
VLITVAAGAGLIVGVAVDLDVQRLPQDHPPIVLGEFPRVSTDSLIEPEWVEAAQMRCLSSMPDFPTKVGRMPYLAAWRHPGPASLCAYPHSGPFRSRTALPHDRDLAIDANHLDGLLGLAVLGSSQRLDRWGRPAEPYPHASFGRSASISAIRGLTFERNVPGPLRSCPGPAS